MEEDVTRRTIAISVQATKLTGRVLCKAFQKFLAQAENCLLYTSSTGVIPGQQL